MSKREPKYEVTFKGLIYSLVGEDDAFRVIDGIELHLHRANKNAIVLDGNEFKMVEVVRDEPKQKKDPHNRSRGRKRERR